MPKLTVHWRMRSARVVLQDGSTVTFNTTAKMAPGTFIRSEADPSNHPAWTGAGNVVNKEAGQVARFYRKNERLMSAENGSDRANNLFDELFAGVDELEGGAAFAAPKKVKKVKKVKRVKKVAAATPEATA